MLISRHREWNGMEFKNVENEVNDRVKSIDFGWLVGLHAAQIEKFQQSYFISHSTLTFDSAVGNLLQH